VIAHAIYILQESKTAKIGRLGQKEKYHAKDKNKSSSGKIVYNKSFASHILTKKTTKRKRSLRKSRLVDKTNVKGIRLLLPNG
jgi:large subunit ribosomal protein L35